MDRMQRTSRRRFIAGIGTVSATVIGAGCTNSNDGNNSSGETTASSDTGNGDSPTTTAGGGGSETSTIAAGPNGNLVFTPETIEIPLGGTVTWNFKSPGHNVSAKPKASEEVELPPGAEPFASYSDGKSYQIVSEGKSYSHTFETPGKYVYICVPHVSSGMIGTVNVSK
jgi:plastocyanin